MIIDLLAKRVPLDENVVDLALGTPFPNFEDALEHFVAREHRITCIVTRNKKDFKKSELPVYTSSEFVQMLRT